MGVNYGLNKVRFTAPVPVGSRLRGHLKLLACEPIDNRRRADDLAGDGGARGQRPAGVHRRIGVAALSLAADRQPPNRARS